ncbi:hypothetical protein PHYSODRAFT_292855 [Phytophthora sojae]|uniref:DDE Tnp4 domain-containing protein n=1 Tax=Phytophthora sojae (strain P6497) TaxID=1094619 RepID=G4YGJ0_PHYSP|nr:hypothetical protein PHYSODRAFT_292855 [Phytophthora sojae]EGZ26525.1 hypothetical protein PHYSODRAFT_292855 [Phytophthora sojae]|eukprot:XP_009513800.1 hypothetical protein PHYSODRAFT_292855 [Phytophthora sojae]
MTSTPVPATASRTSASDISDISTRAERSPPAQQDTAAISWSDSDECDEDGAQVQILRRLTRGTKKERIYYAFGTKPSEQLPRAPFNFNGLSNECIDRFRFDKAQLATLVKLFDLGAIRTRERTAATGVEGLCIVLYKLAVPIRWSDLESFFGRNSSGLSNLFLHVLELLDSKFSDLLHFNHEYAAESLQAYADAVFDAGGLLQNVWAFVDGTVRGVCRPNV